MNHGPAFQALWSKLRNEVQALQSKGYYGDGTCAGFFIAALLIVYGQAFGQQERVWPTFKEWAEKALLQMSFPSIWYASNPEPLNATLTALLQCGGAQSRARPATRRRRAPRQAGPSNHTGAQTVKKRKAGGRVTAKNAFVGDGQALNADVDESKKSIGAGFRKQATRCVTMRLIKAWQRLLIRL